MSITHDDAVLGGEPHIEGTRVGVRRVAGRVVDAGQSPAYVADQLDISLAAVYEALSYYYETSTRYGPPNGRTRRRTSACATDL